MFGNKHVRFLGGEAVATPPSYPTKTAYKGDGRMKKLTKK